MYKLVGEERFLLWAVCSIQLQVLCANGEDKLLLLAEGLLKKHVASHSLHEPEALIVYISILEQQAKYGDALEILTGKLGSLLMMADGPEYVIQCPIQPGRSYTNQFTIQNQEGTLWWHAHGRWLRATIYGALITYPKMGSFITIPNTQEKNSHSSW